MANDVCCRFYVWCETEEKKHKILSSVVDEESDDEFDFNRIIPLSEDDEPCEKWGTRGSQGASCHEIKDTELEFIFTTAWNAPYPVVIEFCRKFGVKGRMTFYDYDYFGGNCGYIEIDENGETEDEEYFEEQDEWGLNFIAEEYGDEVLEYHGYKKDKNGKWIKAEEKNWKKMIWWTFTCHAFCKKKENLDEFYKLTSSACDFDNDFEPYAIGNIWKLDICGDVKYDCWRIIDSHNEELQDVCKRLEITLEIYGEVSSIVEEDEDIPNEWKDEYIEEEDGLKRIYFSTQHIFIWENGKIEEDENKKGKINGYWNWKPDEDMIEHFNEIE